ncbi:MAG: hypothetical protein QM703_27845 [Gemmatales bacterium]
MTEKPERLSLFRRYLVQGYSTSTLIIQAKVLWGLSEEQARQELNEVKRQLALDATTMDILAELMIVYQQHQQGLEIMSRELKGENVTASFHNTHRMRLNDTKNIIISIGDYRDKAGRNRTECPEKEADLAKEKAENAKITWECAEYQAMQGYHYDHYHGMVQPGNNLPSMELAIRDCIRMRMLPKSQYEDFMILQLFNALTEDEKRIDPETLCKEEKMSALHNWDPNVHAEPGQTKYKLYEEMSRIIFLQRVQEYNDIYAKAAQHVDGLMDEKQIEPGMRFPFVGVPPIVKKAADGDKEAIAKLQSMVNRARMRSPEAVAEEAEENRRNLDWGRASAIGLALLLAFCSVWMCGCMIFSPAMSSIVMPLEVTESLMVVDEVVEQTIYRQDAKKAKKAKKNTSHDSWRSSASWRFNSPAFFKASRHVEINSC